MEAHLHQVHTCVTVAMEIGMRSFEGETYGSLDDFKQVEHPVPEPAPDQVRFLLPSLPAEVSPHLTFA